MVNVRKSFVLSLLLLLAAPATKGFADAPQKAPPPPAQPLTSDMYVNLAEKVVPSVVNISTTMNVKSPYPQGFPEDFFRKFFGDMNNPDFGLGPNGPGESLPGGRKMPKMKVTALGSGFIIDSSGIILTNNHVVSNADQIKIQFTEEANEKPATGKVVGRDPDLDIALIKVNEKRKMIPLKLGDSDASRVGDIVMAVGNPFGEGHSATHGIISAKGRENPELPLGSYLQTDAPINPGNSGGPLVNLNGEVIGINTAIQANAQGIGFAIPSKLVSEILPQLLKTGTVRRGYLGLVIEPMAPDVASQVGAPKDLQAPIVSAVSPHGPAAEAGLKPYDVVTQIDSDKVQTPGELTSKVVNLKPGEKVTLHVLRDGKPKTFNVTLGVRPGEGEKQARNEKHPAEAHGQNAGMSVQNMSPEIAQELGVKSDAGVVVTDVQAGSPAEKAGLSDGDIIVEVNKTPVNDVHQFLAQLKKGKKDLLRVEHPEEGSNAFSVAVLDLSKKSG